MSNNNGQWTSDKFNGPEVEAVWGADARAFLTELSAEIGPTKILAPVVSETYEQYLGRLQEAGLVHFVVRGDRNADWNEGGARTLKEVMAARTAEAQGAPVYEIESEAASRGEEFRDLPIHERFAAYRAKHGDHSTVPDRYRAAGAPKENE